MPEQPQHPQTPEEGSAPTEDTPEPTPTPSADTPLEQRQEGPGSDAEQPAAAPAAGRRVTRRTVDRREVTEYTEETITEDLPVQAFQGPSSTHPAPVG